MSLPSNQQIVTVGGPGAATVETAGAAAAEAR
jgi:hypothetical protein